MRLALLFLLIGGGLAACLPVPQTGRDRFSASGETIAMSGGRGGPTNACFACHGLRGEGDGSAAPRLAGLEAGYLRKQLEDYASGLRQDDVMHEAARWLSQQDRAAVATYYAGLAPPPAGRARAQPPTAWLQARGDGLPACAACHGEDGRGIGAGVPSLAGQPAAYTLEQFKRWKSGERRNDPRGVMAIALSGLTEAEARAIADWLEGRPASPRPYTDVARLSAAEAAGERLAASRGARRPGR